MDGRICAVTNVASTDGGVFAADSVTHDQVASLRSMRMLSTDCPEADIRASGFIIPAFLSEEVFHAPVRLSDPICNAAPRRDSDRPLRARARWQLRASRLRLLVGCSVPTTAKALQPVADRLVDSPTRNGTAGAPHSHNHHLAGGGDGDSGRLDEVVDDDEADFTDTDALLEYLLRDRRAARRPDGRLRLPFPAYYAPYPLALSRGRRGAACAPRRRRAAHGRARPPAACRRIGSGGPPAPSFPLRHPPPPTPPSPAAPRVRR